MEGGSAPVAIADLRSGDLIQIEPAPGYVAIGGQVLDAGHAMLDLLISTQGAAQAFVRAIPAERIASVVLDGHGELPRTLLRTYAGARRADAAAVLDEEAAIFSRAGYEQSSQSWTPRTGGDAIGISVYFQVLAAFFTVLGFAFWPLWVAAPLCLAAGLVAGSGSGELSATWTRTPGSFAPPPGGAAPGPAERLRSLKALLDDDLISQADYEAKKAAIVAGL